MVAASAKFTALGLIVFSALLGVVGQILFKRAAGVGEGAGLFGIDLVTFGFGGLVYFVSLVIYVWALKSVPVHLAYPTLAVGYLALFAVAALSGVPVTLHQGVAILLIVAGVALLWM